MQLTFKWRSARNGANFTMKRVERRTLDDLQPGEPGILETLDVADDVARRLMEMGFLPGHIVIPARSAPGGDPRVFRVDGSEIALRRETAAHLWVRTE